MDEVLFKPRFGWGAFTAPCVLTERATHTWDVTDHAIEDGGQISDHIIERPVTVDVSMIFTDTPGDGTDSAGLAKSGLDQLIKLASDRGVADIVTGPRVYLQMAATSVTWQREPDTGKSIGAVVAFRQIKTIASQTAQVPPDAPASKIVPKTVQAKTVKTTEADTPTEATVTQSWAASGFDAISDFFTD